MQNYWEERLRRNFDLTGAGCIVLGPCYNTYLYRARVDALERALKKVGYTLQGADVLEAGCGTGFYAEYCLRQQVSAYVGLDITSVSVETLRERYPDFRFIQADISANEIPETGANFDIVLAADVLFHIIDDAAFERAIRNLCSVLRPGGLLVISDVFPGSTVQIAPHVRLRSLDVYGHNLDQNSARILHIEPIFALLQPPPYIPNASWFWKGYAWFWKYGWRLARWHVGDHLIPSVLAWLDRKLFLPARGKEVPNNKWLLALKG
jgi:SAM-dependent methyltransferase